MDEGLDLTGAVHTHVAAPASAEEPAPAAARQSGWDAPPARRPHPAVPAAAPAAAPQEWDGPPVSTTPASPFAPRVALPQGAALADGSLRGRDIDEITARPAAPAKTRGGFLGRLLRRTPPAPAAPAAADVISQPLPGPGVILVANLKGGAGKTAAAVVLASALGTTRGGRVCLTDIALRGTLGRSTESHGTRLTILDVISHLPNLRDPSSRYADLAQFLRWQPSGQFNVLAGPIDVVGRSATGEPQLHSPSHHPDDVREVLEVLERHHELVVVDTANLDTDAAWRATLEHAGQLVVPTKLMRNHVNGAVMLLETLADTGYGDLARGAIIVVTHGPADVPKVNAQAAAEYRRFFVERGHRVLDLPTDPVIASHGVITWDRLKPATRTAAMTVAAATVEGLASSLRKARS